MQSMTEKDFACWAEGNGLELGPQYPDMVALGFPDIAAESRFWFVPPIPERRPHFIASLLELMGQWEVCYAWRANGSWPAPDQVDQLRVNDVIENNILKGLEIPLGTADILQLKRDEIHSLITLIFSTTIFGWSVGQDLYIVPDHAQQFLKVSHHEVIHATFRDKEEVDRWVSILADRGFSLPVTLPDSTFTRPAWMK